MYRYVLIESKYATQINQPLILSLFAEDIAIDGTEETERSLVLFYQHETDASFLDIVLNIMSDTFVDLRIYVSHTFPSVEARDAQLDFVKRLLARIDFNRYVYLDDRVLVKENLHRIDREIRSFMLRKYADDQAMKETIKSYLEANQNMSVTAKRLFLHRNTLNQRIDKFQQVTGFDPRRFTDAFLIYHLIS
ncbi:MAG: PucR family transcriptional regulator [Acholeplasmataceae bacterium]